MEINTVLPLTTTNIDESHQYGTTLNILNSFISCIVRLLVSVYCVGIFPNLKQLYIIETSGTMFVDFPNFIVA